MLVSLQNVHINSYIELEVTKRNYLNIALCTYDNHMSKGRSGSILGDAAYPAYAAHCMAAYVGWGKS